MLVDVLVFGEGCSGINTAINAARNGAIVAVMERLPSECGLAINGLVIILHTRVREKVVTFGLVNISVKRAIKHNWIQ